MTKTTTNYRRWLMSLASMGLLILGGCAAMNEEAARKFQAEMDAYVGKSADALILARGVPTGTAELAAGGRVLEYSRSQTRITGGNSFISYSPVFVANGTGGGSWVSVPSQQSVPLNATERRCKLIFQISAQNTVLNWRAEGNDCRATNN